MSARTIARPYAKALIDSGIDWSDFLNASHLLLQEGSVCLIKGRKDFYPTLIEWLGQLLQEKYSRAISEHERHFLDLLIRYNRLNILPEIASLYKEALDSKNGVVAVKVKTAFPLDLLQKRTIINALSNKIDAKVELSVEEVPELLAGVIIEYQDQVIDQSLKGRLKSFSLQLDS